MELDFLVSCADKVVDDVGGGSVATGTAEPLATTQALNNAAWRMNATITFPDVSLLVQQVSKVVYLRASMCWKILLFVNSSQPQGFHAIDWHADQALCIIVVKGLSLIVIVVISSPSSSQTTPSSVLTVEQTLVRVNTRKIVRAGVNCRSRIRDQVVSEMRKSTFHPEGITSTSAKSGIDQL